MFPAFRVEYICISRIKVLKQTFFNFGNFVLSYWLGFFFFRNFENIFPSTAVPKADAINFSETWKTSQLLPND
jgi:hypothetical protein